MFTMSGIQHSTIYNTHMHTLFLSFVEIFYRKIYHPSKMFWEKFRGGREHFCRGGVVPPWQHWAPPFSWLIRQFLLIPWCKLQEMKNRDGNVSKKYLYFHRIDTYWFKNYDILYNNIYLHWRQYCLNLF